MLQLISDYKRQIIKWVISPAYFTVIKLWKYERAWWMEVTTTYELKMSITLSNMYITETGVGMGSQRATYVWSEQDEHVWREWLALYYLTYHYWSTCFHWTIECYETINYMMEKRNKVPLFLVNEMNSSVHNALPCISYYHVQEAMM